MGFALPLNNFGDRHLLAQELCAGLRKDDRAELMALTGEFPETFLPAYLAPEWPPGSVWVMHSDAGELAGVGGIAPFGGFEHGLVWMIGTEALDRHPVEFLRASRTWLEAQKPLWGRLSNFVDARNRSHIAWLRWLGFTVEPHTVPFGALGFPFHPFHLDPQKDTQETCALQPSPP